MTSTTTRLGAGAGGSLGAAVIAALLLNWVGPSEIRCGINWINGCILVVIATLGVAVVGVVLRAATPLRGLLGGWFFAALFVGAGALIAWIIVLAPACPFPSR